MRRYILALILAGGFAGQLADNAHAEAKFEAAKALWRLIMKALPSTATKVTPTAPAGRALPNAGAAAPTVKDVRDTALTLGAACVAFSRMSIPKPSDGESVKSAFSIAGAKCEAERSAALRRK